MFFEGPHMVAVSSWSPRRSEVALRWGVTLISRLLIPTHRSRIVLRHAATGFVCDAQIVLSWGVALVGGLAEPAYRSRMILRSAVAMCVHESEGKSHSPETAIGDASAIRQRRGCGALRRYNHR